jgi:hypothetical protein
LNYQYTELYDKWDSLLNDVRRLRSEADSKERQAVELRKTVDALRGKITESLGPVK